MKSKKSEVRRVKREEKEVRSSIVCIIVGAGTQTWPPVETLPVQESLRSWRWFWMTRNHPDSAPYEERV